MGNSGISTGVYLTHLLRAYGVEVVFGIPGVHTVELYRGLAGSGIRHVTPRHEQGAGFMADGYARASRKPGVCFIISGPGMTNILTAMGQAHADSVPMLVISTVNAHGRMGSGQGWLHEMPDQSATVAGVAAFSRTIHRPEDLAPAVAQAFALFASARPRPVHLELPINVMLAEAGHLPVPAPLRLSRPAPDPAMVAEAASLLNNARKTVILAGGGAAHATLAPLAEALDAPVVMTTNARGLLPPGHPLAVSLSPSLPATRALIAAADVVLALGTEMGSTDYDMYEDGGFPPPARLIRVDLDPLQIARGLPATLGIVADAALTVAALTAALPPRPPGDGAARAAAAQAGRAGLSVDMQGDLRILDLVRDTLPAARLVGDSTQLTYAGNLGFAAATAGSWFNSATGFGTLGYGLPAAIGAKLADARPVVAISGDGGLQFVLGELASAAEAQVPVILLLHDNNGYGEIKSYMISKNIPPLGVDILTPDLAAIAAACGWQVARVTDLDALPGLLRQGAAAGGPTLLIFGDDLRAQAAARA
ncbi:acetolactate synthase-1/2/3 large subunit [Gemmobacter aquatilis]|uniref:Acetolactate synthase-1/2/3 large subunit n=1 Tax=Gemmobacter aquatilis TaxID=933059 RepID=A0A1H7YAE3_9RHOB|nr:5-guanidino-2-oxopentanoate decarboxylase [Gemmobacter aquatilis]SEM42925.1 acetolactate synthase-1/2/3 large subunit [Gemmobacter aquatilis]